MPISGATLAGLTTIVRLLDAVPARFVALTVKLNVPGAVGVPEISPAAFMFRPVGKLPLWIDHVGEVPLASSGRR